MHLCRDHDRAQRPCGPSLLLGGLRYREQHYNIQGVNAYLNVIMALAVLGLVLPNFTTSTTGPTFSTEQEIFFVTMSFCFTELSCSSRRFDTVATSSRQRKRGQAFDVSLDPRAIYAFSCIDAGFLNLGVVIFLAEKFAVPLDNSIEQFHMPQAFGGAIIAALVLSPEGLGGITASLHNQLQRSINILFGSVLRRYDRADDPSSADNRTADEKVGSPWSPAWQPTSAAVNPRCECGYVYEPQN